MLCGQATSGVKIDSCLWLSKFPLWITTIITSPWRVVTEGKQGSRHKLLCPTAFPSLQGSQRITTTLSPGVSPEYLFPHPGPVPLAVVLYTTTRWPSVEWPSPQMWIPKGLKRCGNKLLPPVLSDVTGRSSSSLKEPYLHQKCKVVLVEFKQREMHLKLAHISDRQLERVFILKRPEALLVNLSSKA